MLNGRLPFLLSADLLAEYRSVLVRPLLVARHGWDGQTVEALLAALTTAACLRQPESGAAASHDPAPACPAGDQHPVRLLAREPWAALVSGDHPLLDALCGWRAVLTPGEAVAEWAAGA